LKDYGLVKTYSLHIVLPATSRVTAVALVQLTTKMRFYLHSACLPSFPFTTNSVVMLVPLLKVLTIQGIHVQPEMLARIMRFLNPHYLVMYMLSLMCFPG